METAFLLKNRNMLIVLCVVGVIAFGFLVSNFLTVEKAHQTFENYYAFRGCTELIQRTNSYGLCKLKDGSQIKIVNYKGQWYLDGDLPGTWF